MFHQIPDSYKKLMAIYSITCYPTGDMYIGSTKELYHRLRQHGNRAKQTNSRLSKAIREYGHINFQLEVICSFGYDTPDTLENRCILREGEAYAIRERKPSLNFYVPRERTELTDDELIASYTIDCSTITKKERKILNRLVRRGESPDLCSTSGIDWSSFQQLALRGQGPDSHVIKMRRFLQNHKAD